MTELVIRPGLIEELRAELASVMVDGKLLLTHLGELVEMDSTRVYPGEPVQLL
jgi:hypothetical protein